MHFKTGFGLWERHLYIEAEEPKMNEEPKEILTVTEIADLLRCSKAHVERALEGTLLGVPRMAHLLVGKHKVVRREWLQAWMESSKAN